MKYQLHPPLPPVLRKQVDEFHLEEKREHKFQEEQDKKAKKVSVVDLATAYTYSKNECKPRYVLPTIEKQT